MCAEAKRSGYSCFRHERQLVRVVKYRSLLCAGVLHVPMLQCTCGAEFLMPASAAGCMASSPCEPESWYSQHGLNFAISLQTHGVSAKHLADAFDEAALSWVNMECGVAYPPPVNRKHLSWMLGKQRGMMYELNNPDNLAEGPSMGLHAGLFGYCPTCKDVPDVPGCSCQPQHGAAAGDGTSTGRGEEDSNTAASQGNSGVEVSNAPSVEGGQEGLDSMEEEHAAPQCAAGGHSDRQPVHDEPASADAGQRAHELLRTSDLCPRCGGSVAGALCEIRGPQRPPLVNPDGNQKGNRYKCAGRAHNAALEGSEEGPALEPQTKVFYAGANTLNGELEEMRLARLAAGQEEDVPCPANMRCANEVTVSKNDGRDVECTAGAVCGCGVPLIGMFISATRPENFCCYDAMVMWMLQLYREAAARGDSTASRRVAAILLDISCRYGPSLQKRFPALFREANVRFHTGWMHARAGHSLQCQLQFSGEYADGLGRCIGEFIEQLWVSCRLSDNSQYCCPVLSLSHRCRLSQNWWCMCTGCSEACLGPRKVSIAVQQTGAIGGRAAPLRVE